MQRFCKAKIAGSIPVLCSIWGYSLMVECKTSDFRDEGSTPSTLSKLYIIGVVVEWLMTAVLKTADGKTSEGSNPSCTSI